MNNKPNKNVVKYNKWGYYFLIPFFVIYTVFSLIPLFSTIYNSFFEHFMSGLKVIGPNYVGLENYAELLKDPRLFQYAGNTVIMWIIGFVPQILVSLLLAAWFTDPALRLKGQRFFKTVIYLPNLIMADPRYSLPRRNDCKGFRLLPVRWMDQRPGWIHELPDVVW